MTLRLDEVVPWGRSAREYGAMFDLSAADLERRILDCAGGPSSFTAEMTKQGKQVTSCDPLYQWSAAEISRRIDDTYPRMNALNEAEKDHFLWHEYGSPEQLCFTFLPALLPLGVRDARPAPPTRHTALSARPNPLPLR